ncbi:putative uncharacterized protein [Pseudomonas sp. StFLB209]|nr:putative uncharacterized protein [Pseudomonas sp. StFLB209]
MGMLQSFIILFISMQQLFIISMLMPGIGIIMHFMQSASMVQVIMHFIIGMGMPIGIIIGMFMPVIMFIMFMPFSDMHIIAMLPQCIIIGMPQFIIIAIISALFLNMAMSMPAAGFMVHIMASAIISHFMVAIIIGMPIIGIIGMEVFIGICIAFIMIETPLSISVNNCLMAPILRICRLRTRCRNSSTPWGTQPGKGRACARTAGYSG